MQDEVLSGLFRVLSIKGHWAKLSSWDLDDQEIGHVYIGDLCEPSFEEGSLHLMDLSLCRGIWRVEDCSPAYEDLGHEGNPLH